jgi:hypothetical protein
MPEVRTFFAWASIIAADKPAQQGAAFVDHPAFDVVCQPIREENQVWQQPII